MEVKKDDSENKKTEEIATAIKNTTDPREKLRLIALNHHLELKKALDDKLEKEMKALTFKYDKLSLPIYEQQNQLISGKRQIKPEELSKASEFMNEDELKKKDDLMKETPGISGYWLKVLKNSDGVSPDIHYKDLQILKFLENLTCQTYDDSDDFQINFYFKANEFFTNDVLSKKFTMYDENTPIKTTGTQINWKQGKNITVKTVKKTQKNKKSGAKRVVIKEVEDESFFNFFKDSEAPNDEAKDEGSEYMQAEEKFHTEFDIGNFLKDESIPYSLEYYLGVKEDDVNGDDEGFDDLDDEEMDDNPSEEEQKPKKASKGKDKKKHKKSNDSGTGEASKKGEQPECKQQ